MAMGYSLVLSDRIVTLNAGQLGTGGYLGNTYGRIQTNP